MANGLVELERHQVEKSTFPPKCPIYIYDGQVPACCIGQGTVSRVMLQYLPKVEMFFEVDTGISHKMFKTENIRLRNGCPVYVEYKNQDERGGSAKEETLKGIVLGICDIPIDATEIRDFTQDTYWYSIQMYDNPAGSILHEVSPSKVSYRTCEIKEEEKEEELSDDIEILRAPVKIENDDSMQDDSMNEIDLPVPDTLPFPSNKMLDISIQSSAAEEAIDHTDNEGGSSARACKRRSLDSTSIGDTLVATGCDGSQSGRPSLSPPQRRKSNTETPINGNENRQTRKTSYFPYCNDDTYHPLNKKENGRPVERTSWRYIRPGLSEPDSKEYFGRIVYWCGKCNGGNGMWNYQHSEKEHVKWSTTRECHDERDGQKRQFEIESDNRPQDSCPSRRDRKKPRSPREHSTDERRRANELNLHAENKKQLTIRSDQKTRERHYERDAQRRQFENDADDRTRGFSPCSTDERRRANQPNRHAENKHRLASDQKLVSRPSQNNESSGLVPFKHSIRYVPPGPSEGMTKMINGRSVHWCGKCRGGSGYWTGHSEDDHEDDLTNSRKRRRLLNGTNSVDISNSSRKDFQLSPKRGTSTDVRDVNNNYQSSMFKHIYAQSNSIKFLNEQSDIPTSFWDKNTQMCIAYHVKGYCMSTCKRAIDHTEIPEDKLHSFLRWCEHNCGSLDSGKARPRKQSNPNKIFTCKIRLPESTYKSARDSKLFEVEDIASMLSRFVL